jgi:hypothetical protein
VALKPDDVLVWRIPTISGMLSKIVMVVRVENRTLWVTDGYSEIGYIPGDSTFGEVERIPDDKAEHHRSLLSTLWQVHGKKRAHAGTGDHHRSPRRI